MTRRAVFSLLLLVGIHGCDSAEPYANKPQDKAEPAAKEEPVVAAADKEKADEEGCIYAEGEKDHGDQAECPHPPGDPGAAATNEGHFGAPFTLADAQPLGAAVEAKPAGTVLVSGEVEAVCQKKGCWMVIKDGVQSARVLMKDYGFAVPMDSRGKKARVEGTLESRTFTEAQVKHLEKDAGKDPATVAGERTEHVLTATGIEIAS